MDTTLTPSDLFSPSRARQQRAQAQDWAQIESWLSYKYAGRTIPSFEKNEDTLKALRALCTANERADEERTVRERLEREELKGLEEPPHNPSSIAIISTISASLPPTGQTSLTALASTATILNAPDTLPETIAHALIHHTTTAQTLTQHITHITVLQKYLTDQLSLLKRDLVSLQSNPAFTPAPSAQRHTADLMRQTKQLRTKIREYEDKLAALSLQSPGKGGAGIAGSADGIAEILEMQDRLEGRRKEIEELEDEVGRFENLPADREAARREVGRLEVELDGLRRRRDGLFEGLVG